MNQHPRAGMAFNTNKDRGNIVKFFDEMDAQD